MPRPRASNQREARAKSPRSNARPRPLINMHSRRNIYRCLPPLRVHRDGIQILDKSNDLPAFGHAPWKPVCQQKSANFFLILSHFHRAIRLLSADDPRLEGSRGRGKAGDRGSLSHASKTRFQVNARINQRDIKVIA